jgi:hypothetical protein
MSFFVLYTQAVLKFLKLNTQAWHREAFVQGRSLPSIPASVYLWASVVREKAIEQFIP